MRTVDPVLTLTSTPLFVCAGMDSSELPVAKVCLFLQSNLRLVIFQKLVSRQPNADSLPYLII